MRPRTPPTPALCPLYAILYPNLQDPWFQVELPPNALAMNDPCLTFTYTFIPLTPPCLNHPLHTPQDPWFQVELPPNALAMNDHYLTLAPACEQSEAQIREVVAAVRDRSR